MDKNNDWKGNFWNHQDNVHMMWSMIQVRAPELINGIDFRNPTPESIDSLISLFDFLQGNIPPIDATEELSKCIVDVLVVLEENIRYSELEFNQNRVLCAYILQGLLYLLGYNHTILGEYFDLKAHTEIELEKFYLDEDTKELHLDINDLQNYCRFLNVAYRYTLTIPELTGIPTLGHYAIGNLIKEAMMNLVLKIENPEVYFGKTSERIKKQLLSQMKVLESLLMLVISEDGWIHIPPTAVGTHPGIKDIPELSDFPSDDTVEYSDDAGDDEYEIPNDDEIFICLEAYALLEKDALEFVKRHCIDKNTTILMRFFEYMVEQVQFCNSKEDILELQRIFRSGLDELFRRDSQLALKVIPGIRERIIKASEEMDEQEPDSDKARILQLAESVVDISKYTAEI